MRNALIVVSIILAQAALAQQPVAPTPDQAGSPRGENTGDYNVVNSVETGYRFALIGGNGGEYQSQVNYGNGIRLLSSNLTVNSRDGHGRWFDTIVLTTQGLGNDPYQSAALRVEKNKWYRYDLLWRLDDYYNPGLPIAAGEHFMDTSRRMQDHDLTLFPQSKFKLRMGYSRNIQDGPALSTVNLFDYNLFGSNNTSDFPLFENIHRLTNEFRLGADIEWAGFKITLQHTWLDFKEDSNYQESGLTAGDNPAAGVTLSQFNRTEPYHGTSPGWLGSIYRAATIWALNGRFTYVGGERDFILDESALGGALTGAQNQQVAVAGDGRRPVLAADLSISFFPGTQLTVVNNTSVNSIRMNGDNLFEQYNNFTQTAGLINFRYLGIRSVANATDAHYRLKKWLALYGGFHYTTRLIKDIENFPSPGQPFMTYTYDQGNHLQTGIFGVNVKPVQGMSINLDGEIGRADRPFTPVSDRNYQALGARFEYRIRKLTLDAGYKEDYNNNSVSITSYSSHARDYNANVSWAPIDWFALDAGYMKLHLDAATGIAFFAGLPGTPTFDTDYISNIHAATLAARFTVKKRVDIYAGYSITRDVGDGRGTAAPPGATDPVTLIFAPVETFPLSYQSPIARISIRLNEKLRWNAGYQYYNYHEDFGLFGFYQGYHAHTGYTSLSYSF